MTMLVYINGATSALLFEGTESAEAFEARLLTNGFITLSNAGTPIRFKTSEVVGFDPEPLSEKAKRPSRDEIPFSLGD